ncbi:MAG: hypothetical protein HFG16_03930 [Erysipelotrichaceae bacterium]|jgi:hypothetical protein|nr:hypothetical protein [Erysipelotrichaceae bacterium]
MQGCLLFKEYVQQHKRSFNEYAYDHDIHYRAVMFRQFSNRYRTWVEKNGLANDYTLIAYEIKSYEQRLRSYRNKR